MYGSTRWTYRGTRFLVAGAAWRACRAGTAEPDRFVVAPELHIPATRGWPQVRCNLVHDLAALVSRELLQWDDWGLVELDGEPTVEQVAPLDDAAATTVDGEASLERLRALYDLDGLRIPPVVTSYSPAHDEPLRVPVR